MSKMAGRAGSLFGVVGLLLFLFGIFGAPRALAFTGLALIITSFIAFFIEEAAVRRASASS